MYIHGRNETSLRISNFQMARSTQQQTISSSPTEKKDTDLPFTVNVSSQGKNLSMDHEMKLRNLNKIQTSTKVDQGSVDTKIDLTLGYGADLPGRSFLNYSLMSDQIIQGTQKIVRPLEDKCESLFADSGAIEQLTGPYEEGTAAEKFELTLLEPKYSRAQS